jgi:hypothetical protein
VAKAERLGESRNDASDTDNTSRAQHQPKIIFSVAGRGEAIDKASREADACEARGGKEQQAGAPG